jgi:glycosyltransferase involved in cell wall biosynthesis
LPEGWQAAVITTTLYCEDSGDNLQTLLRNIDAKVLPTRGPQSIKQVSGAHEAIEEGVQQADIVHLHTLWHPLNTIARKACLRNGRRYVLMPHGMLDPYSLRQKRLRKKFYLAALERKNLEGASRIVFTTVREQQAARETLPWLARGEVIPIGADYPTHISREDCIATFTSLFPQVSRRRTLLFLGRIHPKKGLERLLAILPSVTRKHKGILLVVAGTGETAYVERVKQLVRANGLDQHVLFTGLLSGDAKFGALACAEVFLLPSRQENFAISMAEAMHMATPVIISDRVDSWPFVETANCGFVVEEAEIEEGFARRIDEVLSAPNLAYCLGKRGQDFARKQFTWERVSRDMVSMYRDILAE